MVTSSQSYRYKIPSRMRHEAGELAGAPCSRPPNLFARLVFELCSQQSVVPQGLEPRVGPFISSVLCKITPNCRQTVDLADVINRADVGSTFVVRDERSFVRR